MASLLSNGVSLFSPQPTTDTFKLNKGFLPKLEIVKAPIVKSPHFRPLRIRATACCDDKIQEILRSRDEYDEKVGFSEDIDSFSIPKGLSRDTIRLISSLKEEPDWMLEFRLDAYDEWLRMKEPKWSDNQYPPIDFNDICYYSAPKKKPTLNSLDETDPQLLNYFGKLGVDLNEHNRLANVAVDAVIDSVSFATTHSEELKNDHEVIFCSMSEAIKNHPDKVRKYLGRVVPSKDNFYAALNSAVFSDGTFCYIPKGVVCPKLLSTYFRINAEETGQFERTLIVAEEGSSLGYLEGCSAASRDRNQLHAAVVELYCHKDAKIGYWTIQNWYVGDEEGRGGIYNFVTKRGVCAGDNSKISWTQAEKGSAITWKYPSVVLEGDNSVGEFYSVALTSNCQQADTGTKMIHKGKNTKSRIVSKGISAGKSRNCYRGQVQVLSKAENARNSSQCDSMIIGDNAAANTYPFMEVKNPTACVEHEATTSMIREEEILYFRTRGIDSERAMNAMIVGFCRDVSDRFPKELKAEVDGLMSLKLEGTVG